MVIGEDQQTLSPHSQKDWDLPLIHTGGLNRPCSNILSLMAQFLNGSDRDDHQCVVDAIAEFAMQSTANILVCWVSSRIHTKQGSGFPYIVS